jgi:hypothetical protein
LQRVATAIQTFCMEHGMLINVAKTELVTFVRGCAGGKPRVSLMGQAVRTGKTARYLGVHFGPPHGITAHRHAHSGSLHGAWARFAASLPNLRCPVGVDLFRHLYTVCVQSVLSYGCELWSVHPRYDRAYKDITATAYRRLYASFGMHHAVPRSVLCDALGLRTLEDHCLLRAVKFWCKLWARPSNDFWLHVVQDNWSDCSRYHVINYSAGISAHYHSLGLRVHGPGSMPLVLQPNYTPIHAPTAVVDKLHIRMAAHFTSVDTDPRLAVHRAPLCTYVRYFRRPFGCTAPPLHTLPLPPHQQHVLFRFVCGWHRLPIHTGRIATPSVPRQCRYCYICGPPYIGDERHMIFECCAVQPLRLQYSRLFTADTATVRTFMWQYARFSVARFIIHALTISVPVA